jgi:hypothetical protein
MSKQSELQLENKLLQQLAGMGYETAKLKEQ